MRAVRVPTAWVEFKEGDTCQVKGRSRLNYFSIERLSTETTVSMQGEAPTRHDVARLRNDRTGRLAGWCWASELLPDDRNHRY